MTAAEALEAEIVRIAEGEGFEIDRDRKGEAYLILGRRTDPNADISGDDINLSDFARKLSETVTVKRGKR